MKATLEVAQSDCHQAIVTFDEEWQDEATGIRTMPLWKFLLQGIEILY